MADHVQQIVFSGVADFTAVDREIDRLKAKAASIQFGGGSGGPSTSLATSGGGGSGGGGNNFNQFNAQYNNTLNTTQNNVTAVLNQVQNTVNQAVSNVFNQIQSTIQNITSNVQNVSNSTTTIINNAAQQAAGAGGGTGASLRGLGRFASVGFLGREAFNFGEAYRQRNIAGILAGSDQDEQLKADLALRKRLTAFPIAGPLADLIDDPTGSAQAGIDITLRQSSLDAKQSAQRASQADLLRSVREQSTEAGFGRGYDAERLRIEFRRQEQRRRVEESFDAASSIDEGQLQAQRTALTLSPNRRARIQALTGAFFARGGTGLTPEEQVDRQDDETITSLRRQNVLQRQGKRDQAFGQADAGAASETAQVDFRQQTAGRLAGIEAESARLKGQGRYEEAAQQQDVAHFITRVVTADPTQRQAEFLNASTELFASAAERQRNRDTSLGGLQGQGSELALTLARNPLGAKLAGIDIEAQRDIKRLGTGSETAAARRQIQENAERRKELARRENTEDIGDREQRLRDEVDVSALEAAGQPGSARALSIARRALTESADLARTPDLRGEAKLTLQNALNQEQAYRRRLLYSGSAEEVASGTLGPGFNNSGDTEDTNKKLDSIDQGIKDLNTAINALGGTP